MYAIEVSPDVISTVPDAVIDEVRDWQQHPLEAMYPVVFVDVPRVKVRDEGTVKNKAIYLALCVRRDGTRDVLGLWIEQTEGAKFWLRVVNDLKLRGVQDVLIAVVDGLKGFPRRLTRCFQKRLCRRASPGNWSFHRCGASVAAPSHRPAAVRNRRSGQYTDRHRDKCRLGDRSSLPYRREDRAAVHSCNIAVRLCQAVVAVLATDERRHDRGVGLADRRRDDDLQGRGRHAGRWVVPIKKNRH